MKWREKCTGKMFGDCSVNHILVEKGSEEMQQHRNIVVVGQPAGSICIRLCFMLLVWHAGRGAGQALSYLLSGTGCCGSGLRIGRVRVTSTEKLAGHIVRMGASLGVGVLLIGVGMNFIFSMRSIMGHEGHSRSTIGALLSTQGAPKARIEVLAGDGAPP